MKESEMEMACPIPTAEEAELIAIFSEAEGTMLAKIRDAIMEASETVSSRLRAARGEQQETPPVEYFVSVANQYVFCRLCDADHKTLSGGNLELAEAIINNYRGIVSTWEGAGQETP